MVSSHPNPKPSRVDARAQGQLEAGAKSLPPAPELAAYEATPSLARLGADVGQDDVGVQVGVPGVICHVLEARRHDPSRCYLFAS